MRIRNSNAYAILIVLVLLAVMFTGYYVALFPFGKLYEKFTNESKYSVYLTRDDCKRHGGIWENSECKPLPDRAMELVQWQRRVWLILPIIVAIGLIFWILIVATRRDPQQFNLR